MIIFKGNETVAYRDPACYYFEGRYHLFFTLSIKKEGYIYNHVATSQSCNLFDWTPPQIITETDKLKNYCSPGNVIKHNDEYLICITSYPMPVPFLECSYADNTARLYMIRTKDFKSFSAPEKIYAKGKKCRFENEGRMIDPFLFEKDGEFLLFFKQNGISLSVSTDLENWEFRDSIPGGENTCILKKEENFLLIHSPNNGIGLKESTDLKTWEDKGVHTLEQQNWDWSSGRLTAGFAMESNGETKYKYVLFFHGSKQESFPETHGDATLACVFTDDFKTFSFDP